MTCQEAQSLINAYVNQQMDIRTLEKFINHIEYCADCKEELEVYYMLLTSIKQLDEDKNVSADFHGDFLTSIEDAKERILLRKIRQFRNRIAFCVIVVVSSFVLSFSTGYYEVESSIPSKTRGKSEFKLPVQYSHFILERSLREIALRYKGMNENSEIIKFSDFIEYDIAPTATTIDLPE